MLGAAVLMDVNKGGSHGRSGCCAAVSSLNGQFQGALYNSRKTWVVELSDASDGESHHAFPALHGLVPVRWRLVAARKASQTLTSNSRVSSRKCAAAMDMPGSGIAKSLQVVAPLGFLSARDWSAVLPERLRGLGGPLITGNDTKVMRFVLVVLQFVEYPAHVLAYQPLMRRVPAFFVLRH